MDFGKKQVLISSDMLVEGVHFNLSYVPLKHLGYKAVVSNLSDIYSMNRLCTQITVNIAVSNRFNLESLDELYFGINAACKKFNVDLVGVIQLVQIKDWLLVFLLWGLLILIQL